MYIQLTERCNMRCAHCCMDATEEGADITQKVFEKALQSGDYVTLGGGEPTLHRNFEKFLLLAIARCEHVHVVTNGKRTERALLLAKLAKGGVIGADLSRDDWHEEIEQKVVDAFTQDRPETTMGDDDLRGIRNVTENVIATGRCDWGITEGGAHCVCSDPIIKPNGDIKACGCDSAPILTNVTRSDWWDELNDGYEEAGKDFNECWNCE